MTGPPDRARSNATSSGTGIERSSRGNARFEDATTVAVLGADGAVLRAAPRTRFSSPRARLAFPPPGIAMRDLDLVDSDRILDLDRVPTTLTVVGGGVHRDRVRLVSSRPSEPG